MNPDVIAQIVRRFAADLMGIEALDPQFMRILHENARNAFGKQKITQADCLSLFKAAIVYKVRDIQGAQHQIAEQRHNARAKFDAYLVIPPQALDPDAKRRGLLKAKQGVDIKTQQGFAMNQGGIKAANINILDKAGHTAICKSFLESDEDTTINAEGGDVKVNQSNVKAGGDINVKGNNVSLESEAERHGGGENYVDVLKRTKLEADKKINVDATKNIGLKAIETKSGTGGTHFNAGENITDQAVQLHEHHEQHEEGRKRSYHRVEHRVTHEKSKHTSDGDVTFNAGGAYHGQAPDIHAKGKAKLKANQGIDIDDVQDIHTVEETITKKGRGFMGFGGGKKTTQSSKKSSHSKGGFVKGDGGVEIDTDDGDINLKNVSLSAPKSVLKAAKGAVRILLGVNDVQAQSTFKSQTLLWQSQGVKIDHDRTYAEGKVEGELEIISQETLIQAVQGGTCDILDHLSKTPNNLTVERLQEIHTHINKKVSGPTKALTAVIGLAVGMATSGFASAFGGGLATKLGLAGHTLAGKVVAGMGSAGLTALSSQAAIALVSEKGDIAKAAKSLIKKDALKSLGVAVAVAGLTAGLADALDIKIDAKSLGDETAKNLQKGVIAHAKANLVKVAAKGAVKIALEDAKIEDVLLDGIKDIGIATAAGVAANHIGEAKANQDIDPVTHKIFHALLGGAQGALADPESAKKGFIAGALGSALSETLVEVLSDDIGTVIHQAHTTGDPHERESILIDYLDRQLEIAKLLTVGVAGLLGQDVDIVQDVADNALHNNFFWTALDIGLTTWEFCDAYEEKGLGAAAWVAAEGIVLSTVGFSTLKAVYKLLKKSKGVQGVAHNIVKKRDKLYEAHHIISDKNLATKNHELWTLAGVNPSNYSLNKILLPTKKGAAVGTNKRSIHEGKHLGDVSKNLAKKMKDIVDEGKGLHWNPQQYKQELDQLLWTQRKLLKEGKIKLNKNHRPWADQ